MPAYRILHPFSIFTCNNQDKQMKIKFLHIALPITFLFFAACSQQAEKTTEVQNKLSEGSDSLKTNYVCPMHSEVKSAEPDTCRICGMDLEKSS